MKPNRTFFSLHEDYIEEDWSRNVLLLLLVLQNRHDSSRGIISSLLFQGHCCQLLAWWPSCQINTLILYVFLWLSTSVPHPRPSSRRMFRRQFCLLNYTVTLMTLQPALAISQRGKFGVLVHSQKVVNFQKVQPFFPEINANNYFSLEIV